MILTKTNGKFVSLKNANSENPQSKRAQSDYKGEFFCDDCEDRFTEDDTFASQFFRDGLFPSKSMPVNLRGRPLVIIEYDGVVSEPLHYFAIGILLRFELYYKSIGLASLLGNRFSHYSRIYSERRLTLEDARMAITRFDFLGLGVHADPKRLRFKGRNSVQFTICGHLVHLVTDSLGGEDFLELKLINSNLCRYFVDPTRDSRFVQGLMHAVAKTYEAYTARYGKT